MNICAICNESLNIKDKLDHTLTCNHAFHYECLYNSFKYSKNLDCPYCRSIDNKLPLVNGIKKINEKIHILDENYTNILCDNILKSGKNKGKKCGNNCVIGFNKCKKHL